MTRTKPCEVIGHGGADGFYPANTEASFRKAIELGVDRIECDLTADFDRVLFLFHDQVVLFDGKKRDIRNLSIEQVSRIDPDVLPLERLLEIAGGTTPILLDLKPRGLEDDVIVAIERMRADTHDVSVSSTHARSLRRLARAFPDMRIGLSRGQWATRFPPGRPRSLFGWIEGCLQIVPLLMLGRFAHATEVMLYHALCVPPLIRALHHFGIRVYAWTPDRPSEFRTLLLRGVDGIITHRPDRLMRTMDALGVPRL